MKKKIVAMLRGTWTYHVHEVRGGDLYVRLECVSSGGGVQSGVKSTPESLAIEDSRPCHASLVGWSLQIPAAVVDYLSLETIIIL
jgi:hypothetical protein